MSAGYESALHDSVEPHVIHRLIATAALRNRRNSGFTHAVQT
jgi:hypothetical protein